VTEHDCVKVGDRLIVYGDVVEIVRIDRGDPRGAVLVVEVVERQWRPDFAIKDRTDRTA
jgi:hypothetical protein